MTQHVSQWQPGRRQSGWSRPRASRTSARRSTTRPITITDSHGNAVVLGVVRQGGVQGIEEDRRPSPPPSPPSSALARRSALGVKRVHVRVQGPGSGRESAIQALATAGLQVKSIKDVTPDSAQRLPSAQASESLSHGSLYRAELPAVPPRRHQALPQGHQVLHGEVPGRASSLRAGPARPEHGAPAQVVRVLEAAAREAEDQAHLRVSEQQFRNTFEKVRPLPGITGHNLLAALESRLDNMVYRMGFAASRKAARQLVRHRHVEVNGKRVDIPSYWLRPVRRCKVRQKSRELVSVLAAMDQASRGAPLAWLAVDRDTFSGRMLERPSRAEHPDRGAGAVGRRVVLQVSSQAVILRRLPPEDLL